MRHYVTLKDLGKLFRIDRSGVRKFVAGMGIPTIKVRAPEGRGQQVLAVTKENAEKVIAERKRRGFTLSGDKPSKPKTRHKRGVFYLVLLDEEARPGRIKAGFSKDMKRRLMDHRCSAPEAKVVKTWPIMRTWEPFLLAVVGSVATTVGSEVFDTDDLDAVVSLVDQSLAWNQDAT